MPPAMRACVVLLFFVALAGSVTTRSGARAQTPTTTHVTPTGTPFPLWTPTPTPTPAMNQVNASSIVTSLSALHRLREKVQNLTQTGHDIMLEVVARAYHDIMHDIMLGGLP